jgi:rfaE bifunctional protein kinase chain/domain
LDSRKINKIFDSFNRLKVLIIGDVMVDSYMWGKVSRISPEAPVPIVAVNKKENRLGGAANVALNIQAMGATPILCSFVGKDSGGDLFFQLLKDQKLPLKGILRSSKRSTTIKTRVIGNNHQLIRVDEELESDLDTAETKSLSGLIAKIVKEEKIDAIVFEDYDKGLITPVLIDKTIELANKNRIPVIVDPKKRNFFHYKGVSLFKPNLKEFKEGLKHDFDHRNAKELEKAVTAFMDKQNIDTALITLSEQGLYVNSRSVKKIIPAHIRNIADVSGAGDTVVSVAAMCIALGLSPLLVAEISNLAGGLVCEHVGVVPINREQLLKEIQKIGISE